MPVAMTHTLQCWSVLPDCSLRIVIRSMGVLSLCFNLAKKDMLERNSCLMKDYLMSVHYLMAQHLKSLVLLQFTQRHHYRRGSSAPVVDRSWLQATPWRFV